MFFCIIQKGKDSAVGNISFEYNVISATKEKNRSCVAYKSFIITFLTYHNLYLLFAEEKNK